MSRAPSRLPSMSPMTGALVPYQPRALGATPSPSRKRSLGMLRDMSPAVSLPFQDRLTRFSTPRLDSRPQVPRSREPASLLHDIDSLRRLRHDRDEHPPHDRSPISPWPIPTLVPGSAEPRRLIMIDVDETSDLGSLERDLPPPQSLPHHCLLSPVW